ncbi:MAG: ECF-type sigma factor, partial [Phycisphaerae bacterium]
MGRSGPRHEPRPFHGPRSQGHASAAHRSRAGQAGSEARRLRRDRRRPETRAGQRHDRPRPDAFTRRAHRGRRVDLEDAMQEFALLYPRAARVVELKFFGGLTAQEIATVLGVGDATVERDWVLARGWLNRRM